MPDIHLVTSCDNQYTPYVGVMLYSLIQNYKGTAKLVVHILTDGLSVINQAKMKTFENDKRVFIDFKTMDPDVFKLYKTDLHINHMTYYRLAMADLLDVDIKKVIYLDGDILVLKDIQELWDVDLEGHVLAAVVDPIKRDHTDLGMPASSRYFNAGVMLIDLEKWRSGSIGTLVKDFLVSHMEIIEWWDQDGLNAVLHDRWKMLDRSWNWISDKEELNSLKKDRSALNNYFLRKMIVHFLSDAKPWQSASGDPRSRFYMAILRKTPWEGTGLSESNSWKKAKKFIIGLLPETVSAKIILLYRKWNYSEKLKKMAS